MSRSSHSQALLGATLAQTLSSTHVLIVGAGGIGSELVKNIVLAGFGNVTLLDLDTIDLSNLNRQFLFRKKDVKQSKAFVAARTASMFNPSCKIIPIYANIKEPNFDVLWFKRFDIVLNALDNLDARRHVNRMCMASGVPLIESGTAGYSGQVQPIIKDVTECFDCIPKETPKTFPVCTIRSTPNVPIHCIVWAKTYLFQQLFGEEEDSRELDNAQAAGENAAEISNLRKEANEFRTMREALSKPVNESSLGELVFNKIFRDDISRLLTMSDMWKHRKPPQVLDRDSILNSTVSAEYRADVRLRDQKTLSLHDNIILFDASLLSLATRLRTEAGSLSFDKDDNDSLDFVTASSNLRSYAYGITTLTRWDVKEMAGNIIPAIATTNAIIAGGIALQALQMIRGSSTRSVFIQSQKPSVLLNSSTVSPPNPRCSVCRETYVHVQASTSATTLAELLDSVLKAGEGQEDFREVSVYEGGRVLSDPEWLDNMSRTLDDLSCGVGKFVTLVDESETYGNICLAISSSSNQLDPKSIILTPSEIKPSLRPSPRPVSPPSSPLKRVVSPAKTHPHKRAADEDTSTNPPQKQKRARITMSDSDDDVVMLHVPQSSQKSREALELEEEGLVIVGNPC